MSTATIATTAVKIAARLFIVSDLRIPDHLAFCYVGSADYACIRDLECRPYLDLSEYFFLEFGIEHTLHGVLDVVEDIVYHPVCLISILSLSAMLCTAVLGLTLKPIMTASEVPASIISDSVTVPTPV